MCFQTGHLQNTCPLTKKIPKRKKKQPNRPKGWNFNEPPLLDEEEEENKKTQLEQLKDKMDGEVVVQDGSVTPHPTGPEIEKQ